MKKILCLFSFIVTVFVAQAQERPMNGRNMQPPPPRQMTKEQRERLELFKIQFITKKIDLTPAEAEKFWPVYNEQKDASQKLMQEKKDYEIEFQEAMLVIRKKFKKELMPILKTEDRVNLALKVDRELLNKMRTEMMRRRRPIN
jgi:hypothetical protein